MTNTDDFRNDVYEANQLRVLMELEGNKSKPITNVTIDGLRFIDTRYTFLDDHGIPRYNDTFAAYFNIS